MNITSFKMICLGVTIGILSVIIAPSQSYAQNNPAQTTETIEGKSYIIHKIKSGDTYYRLSRTYGIAVNDIMVANNKKNLRAGDTARVPLLDQVEQKETATSNPSTQDANSTANDENLPDVLTEYKVGKNETLYSIGQRFGISVGTIKTMNKLRSDNLREGQLLKIPADEIPLPEPVAPVVAEEILEASAEEPKDLTVRDFNTSRFGIRETSEKGVGVWMENLETRNNSNLALHKTAPVGTVLKITNPITKSVTYAKVVGKFSENTDTQNAIVVLSKSAAAYIGALDKRFVVELTYGLPLE